MDDERRGFRIGADGFPVSGASLSRIPQNVGIDVTDEFQRTFRYQTVDETDQCDVLRRKTESQVNDQIISTSDRQTNGISQDG